jgi:flagellar basal body-associated protein FliL
MAPTSTTSIPTTDNQDEADNAGKFPTDILYTVLFVVLFVALIAAVTVTWIFLIKRYRSKMKKIREGVTDSAGIQMSPDPDSSSRSTRPVRTSKSGKKTPQQIQAEMMKKDPNFKNYVQSSVDRGSNVMW